ncbi:MAG: AlpA family phage regulatory protein [Proteobacteria bacterium]|nr:AlpA family phage regulatory protein [Pseudomonadota bacterium]
MPEAGGGGASAGVTDGPDVAASDDDDGGDGDGEDDCRHSRSKRKQPSPGPAPHKRGNARTGTRNAATKPPQPVDALLLRLPAVLSTFPVSRSAWFQGVKDGRYPKPVRLGARAVAWRASDIRSLVDSLAVGQ